MLRAARSTTPRLSLPSSGDEQALRAEIDREVIDPAAHTGRAKSSPRARAAGRPSELRQRQMHDNVQGSRANIVALGDIDLRQRRPKPFGALLGVVIAYSSRIARSAAVSGSGACQLRMPNPPGDRETRLCQIRKATE